MSLKVNEQVKEQPQGPTPEGIINSHRSKEISIMARLYQRGQDQIADEKELLAVRNIINAAEALKPAFVTPPPETTKVEAPPKPGKRTSAKKDKQQPA